MDRYTVLLVDDEEAVIQIIMKKIDWEKLGFQVIGYANNGLRGLEMFEEYEPDVVMTDIKMPYMDGMEMSKRIKTNYPAAKILLFSGFDEFEYAKEAIHIEVEEYLLKPVSSVELTEVFKQLKDKLDMERSNRKNVETLRKYYEESLPLLKMDFYSSLLKGKMSSEDIKRLTEEYNISLSGPHYCCVVFHISDAEAEDNLNPAFITAAVQKHIKDKFEERWRAVCLSYQENLVLIVQLKSENEIVELTNECDRFCKYISRTMGVLLTAGIGPSCSSVQAISDAYNGGRKAVSYRAIYGTSKAININEIAPGENNRDSTEGDDELAGIFKSIYLASDERIASSIDRYLKCIVYPRKNIQLHQVDMMQLISEMYRFSAVNGIEVRTAGTNMAELYQTLLDMSPETLRKWLNTAAADMSESLKKARSSTRISFVKKAIEYIHKNYADEALSLDRICEVLAVSNSYFATVFKKETGKSFVEYLTDYRMNIAAERLRETDEKSYVIAKAVGYADANYFSYVFKKQFGTAPSKFRTERGKLEE